MATRTAPARRRRHPARPSRRVAAPRPRRVSGPLHRTPALAPRRRRGGTGAFERIRALPEHRVVDRLLRGRAWIWLVGVMLGGIVAMQVSLLQLNAGISQSIEQAGALERRNADLEARIARLSSGDRIQATAAKEGMVAPPAGAVGFLTARPRRDARLAAARMEPPSDTARKVVANGGIATGEIMAELGLAVPDPAAAAADPAGAPAEAGAATPAATVAEPGTTTTTAAPVTPAAEAPAPSPTPAPASTQPAQPQGAAPADPGTGAAAAPGVQG
jgi:hypothetical protein